MKKSLLLERINELNEVSAPRFNVNLLRLMKALKIGINGYLMVQRLASIEDEIEFSN